MIFWQKQIKIAAASRAFLSELQSVCVICVPSAGPLRNDFMNLSRLMKKKKRKLPLLPALTSESFLRWFQLLKPNLPFASTFVQLSALHSLSLFFFSVFLSLLFHPFFSFAPSSLSTRQTPHRQTMMLLHRSLSIFLFIPTEMSNEPQAALTHQPEHTGRHRNTLSPSVSV